MLAQNVGHKAKAEVVDDLRECLTATRNHPRAGGKHQHQYGNHRNRQDHKER